MLNNEQRAIYVKACMVEPLKELGGPGARTSYDPAKDFLKLVDRARGRAVTIHHWGFKITNAEIMEALRVSAPAQYAMTVEWLVEKYVGGGIDR